MKGNPEFLCEYPFTYPTFLIGVLPLYLSVVISYMNTYPNATYQFSNKCIEAVTLVSNEFIKEHIKNGKIFGICLGMQILHSLGEENGNSLGLNYIKGKVIKINSTKKIILPFVGYQKVKFLHKKNLSFLKKYNLEKFYFVHSYIAKLNSNKNLLALTKSNDIEYPAAVIDKNIIGTQFHPEKSGEVGLLFLKDIINNF